MKKINFFNLRFAATAILLLVFVACEKTDPDQMIEGEAISQERSVKTGQTDPCEKEQSFLELYTKDNIDVGHVSIMNDGTNIYVTYFADEGWFLKETNLFVGKKEDIPLKKDGEPDKDKFPFVDKFIMPITSYEYVIPIVEGEDCYVVLAHAKVNNCDDDVDCGECDGKATNLTLRYDGDTDAVITVIQKKDAVVVFDETVAAGEEFSFVGTDKKGTLGTEITIKVDGVVNTKIHTSCSQPLYIGLVKGDFTIVDGYSRNGGQFCTSTTPPPNNDDDCDCEGKVTNLTMTYDGDTDALITVKQKKDDVVIFNENVDAGEEFSFVGTDKGTLGTEIYLSINGDQNTAIHTSCSQPIYIGMTSGSFTIVDGYSKNGGQLCTGDNSNIREEYDDSEEEKCKDKSAWADGGIIFKEYFDTDKWGLVGEYCLEECELVIAFKAFMTTDFAITSGGPGNIDFLAYYNFAPNYMGHKIYLNSDYLNSNTDNPVGNIVVSDLDNDGLWEVKVDNTDRPDLKFLGGAYLFVGTLDDYSTSIFQFPYIYQLNTERDFIIFQLDF
ncbi:hypothetical protein DWB61_01685 [Ancylomarina euxinus]|uniref:DUF7467 domain-containing protein n=1 Tax=Ancylomarina euxinus TaxID=2283627 RepID=A0A425Y8K6_9BACT|nr:hypothetical protein [Ancylomarina euxinus]MCZ4693379.1 hypothetical protein [Ancylomarina euxinus]MUP13607.1 hypothetical protein [Ancylomarina euxinus]RRG24747.1 hypothetical protein DWB61_01685 [Ancylomarina euxinus]